MVMPLRADNSLDLLTGFDRSSFPIHPSHSAANIPESFGYCSEPDVVMTLVKIMTEPFIIQLELGVGLCYMSV